ncbi:MAG: type IV secretory system conjugative DNA transfer family protein [Candidatus Dojkabacteria bacterium]
MDFNSIIQFSVFLAAIFTVLYFILIRFLNLRVKVSETIKEQVILKISVPVKNDKKPASAEQFFQALHGVIQAEKMSKELFSFEIYANPIGIFFLVVCNKRYKTFIENQIYAQYPEAQIEAVHDYAEAGIKKSLHRIGIELRLSKEFFLPIKTFQSFEVDPLASITSAVSKLDQGTEVFIQLLARPIDNSWQAIGKRYIDSQKNRKDAEGNKLQIEEGKSAEFSEIEKKNNKVGFQGKIRILVQGPDDASLKNLIQDIEASFRQFQTAQLNSLIKPKDKRKSFIEVWNKKLGRVIRGTRLGDTLKFPAKYQERYLDEREPDIFNIEELASIFHLPNESVKTPNIAWAKSKKLEFPLNLPMISEQELAEIKAGATPRKGMRLMGLTDYRNIHIPFGIKDEDRRRHMYLLGKTGTGKSTFMKNMILGDIMDGKGLAVLDPHGELVEEVLELIPESRMKDVIYLDPSDIENPIGLNMLDIHPDETMDLLADGIVNVFKKFFGDSWGPRLQYILTNAILTLLHCQNVSLLAVQRILTDKNYRKFLLKQVKDPFLLKFWQEEYEQMAQNPRLLAEALAPIQNKVGRFLSSPMVRNMIGQIKSSIDLQDIMNSEKIFLVNLSQGKIGEENSSLLGGMIVTRLYSNAMQRAKIAKEDRKDFYLYVDEFQNFATESFVKILSEARKYALNLIVTHQYIDQIDPTIQDAIFGNVGTLMNYVVGQKDALRLEKEYTPYLASEDLVNLDKYRLAMKMTVDGAQTPPFTAIALKPQYIERGLKEQIKQASRDTYAKSRADVESKLNKYATQSYDNKGNLMQNNATFTSQKNDKPEKSEEKPSESPHEKKKDNNSVSPKQS